LGDAHLGSDGLCLAPFESTNAQGVIGTWTSSSTSQLLDDSGAPTGPVTQSSDSYQLAADGSFAETTANGPSTGTWQRTGNVVTLTQSGLGGNVQTLTLALVDGEVLCDPVFKK
jgi:hypothetical protein